MNTEPFETNSSRIQPGSYIAENLRVIGFLGSGGMSDVYKCRDEGLGRDVAVKTLKIGFTDESLRRLQIEGRAVAGLEHTNIVQLYGLRTGANSLPVLVMEYINGVSLANLLEKEGPLALTRSLRIALQIAEGLQAAQRRKVIHRDLKPSNIMIINAGALDEQVKILDFGIAKIQNEIFVKATQTGTVVGTPQYMSPEQAMGKKCDGRSDQYSLGCILFEMLCGHPPFTHDSVVAILIAHQNEQAPSLSHAMKVAAPLAVHKLVAKLLQKDPDDRYESMYDVGQAIFAASARNKLALGRIIGIALGFVSIVAAIIIFNLRGLEHKDLSVQSLAPNTQPRQIANTSNVAPALESHADNAEVPLPPPRPATKFNNYDRELLAHANDYIHNNAVVINSNDNLSDAGLAALVRGRTFNTISIRKCGNLTSASVKALVPFALSVVDVADTKIDDYAADYFAQMSYLETLCLKDLTITNRTCEKLVGLPRLLQLTLAGTSINGKSLIPLSHIASLRILDLEYTKVGGSISNLKDSHVEDLILSDVDKLTQRDFDNGILQMKNLRAIHLEHTLITDDQVLSLSFLKDLDHIDVRGCPSVTYANLVNFHNKLPQCFITQNYVPDAKDIWPTISKSKLTGPEMVVNGDFEMGKTSDPDQSCGNESSVIPNWRVRLGTARWVSKKIVTPAGGKSSLELNGAIEQKLITTPGVKYCVRFKVASCPDPDLKSEGRGQSLEVRVGSNNLRYSLPFTKNSVTEMGWRDFVWTFRATANEAVLQFAKPFGSNPLGPFIDDISVKQVIEK